MSPITSPILGSIMTHNRHYNRHDSDRVSVMPNDYIPPPIHRVSEFMAYIFVVLLPSSSET